VLRAGSSSQMSKVPAWGWIRSTAQRKGGIESHALGHREGLAGELEPAGIEGPGH